MARKKITRKKHIVQDYLEAILFAFVVAMVIRNYTFQNFKIPSSSMESTLLIGDFLAASKFVYFFTDPKREDIVTFRYPADPEFPQPADNYVALVPPVYWNKSAWRPAYYAKKNVVKRVIGMPGDKIEIKDKKVYINDQLFKRDYAQFKDRYRNIPRAAGRIYWGKTHQGSRDNFGPITVPDGKYFVLGDNRDNSLDSRFWGFLDRQDITGTPSIIFWSAGDGEIRWDRIFRIIK